MCKICREDLNLKDDKSDAIKLVVCSDTYHAECLKGWVVHCVENSLLPVLCPEETCRVPIAQPDMTRMLSEAQMDRCERFEWKKIRDENHDVQECLTDNCNYL